MISAIKLSLLLSVLSTVESNGNRLAFNYAEQAFGQLQIRRGVIEDVNKYCLQTYTLDDAFDSRHARDIAALYLRLRCSAEQKYSFEDAARIWNGGPDGWWKLSTLPYWRKVEAELKARGLDSRGTIKECPPPRINLLPGGLYLSTLGTTAASSSRSDLAMSFHFVLNANEAKARSSMFSISTTKPSVSKPAPRPASLSPTSVPAKTPPSAVVFEFHWVDTR